jgi:DNA-binding NarL/FixJ family response regulator
VFGPLRGMTRRFDTQRANTDANPCQNGEVTNAASPRINLLVVEDEEAIMEPLAEGLEREGFAVTVASTGEAALSATGDIDLVLLDLHMPGRTGLDLLGEIKTELPSVPVVVLSSDETRNSVINAIDKGAVGYIPKSSTTSVMTQALRLVLAGGIYLPAVVLENEIDELPESPESRLASETDTFPDLGLTPRQLDIMRCLFRGMSTKLICRELKLQESTVKTHMREIFETLNVHTRTQAILVASQRGVQLGKLSAPGRCC